jgi:hypothetical protein
MSIPTTPEGKATKAAWAHKNYLENKAARNEQSRAWAAANPEATKKIRRECVARARLKVKTAAALAESARKAHIQSLIASDGVQA